MTNNNTGEGNTRSRNSNRGTGLSANQQTIYDSMVSGGASQDLARNLALGGSKDRSVFRPSEDLIKRSAEPERSVGEVTADSRREVVGEGLLSFPPNMPRIYMAFNFANYVRPSGFDKLNLEHIQTINLPLPMQLLETYMVDIGPEDTNFVGDAARNVDQGTIDATLAALRAQNVSGVESGDLVRAAMEAAGSWTSRFLRDRANGMMSNAGDVVTQLLGVIPNPHTSVFFNGVRMRQLMFSWKLSAQSEDESRTLKAIIDAFKHHSLPKIDTSSSTSFLLQYPHIVKPEIIGTEYGFDFKYAFVTNITVVHTPEEPAYYKSGAPVAYLITLDLMEIEYFLRDDARPETNLDGTSNIPIDPVRDEEAVYGPDGIEIGSRP